MRMEGTRNTEWYYVRKHGVAGSQTELSSSVDGALDSAGQESSWQEGNGRRTKSSFPA